MLVVGVALSARSWRGELQRHCRDHVSDLVVTLLHDGRDAVEAGVDVVIADDETSWLSASFVTESRDLGVPIIGLFDPSEADGFGRLHLERLGVDCAVPTTLEAEGLVDLVRMQRPPTNFSRRLGVTTAPLSGRRAPQDRRVIAVGGPAGAGATEVAIGVAQLLAACGDRPVLVDVDETHPSLARRLTLGLHPHLLTAVDAVRREHTSPTDGGTAQLGVHACLAKPASGVSTGERLRFDVLVGLASRDDWSLVRADDVRAVVTELAAQWPVVVARLGPCLEDLSRHVERYELSRTIAGGADRVIGVCDASATGLMRFLDWLVDVVGVIGDADLDVVVNRAPRWPGVRQQLVDRLRDVAGDRVNEIVCLPDDRRVARAAWDGTSIPEGRFLRALRRLPLTDESPSTSEVVGGV